MAQLGGLHRADGSPVRLSRPARDMQVHYDVLVVGSGYGGAIAACRLSRAGRSVCVLERGKELQPGEYPSTLAEAAGQMQIQGTFGHVGSPTGMFDFHAGKGITALVGCGLGGGSLINANVGMKPEAAVFDEGWPAAFQQGHDEQLQLGYHRARAMLRPMPYPDGHPTLAKLEALKASADGVGEPFTRTPIYVTFEARVNEAGIKQAACTNCGDCVSGCNYGAKNTVLMNYLPDAVDHGAHVVTEVSVHHVQHRPDRKWAVLYSGGSGRRRYRNAPLQFVTADVVVLAAGTLGSTEILLRSKAAGLPASDQVGERFSGNGDLLGFAYDADRPVHGVGLGHRNPVFQPAVGPCITGMIDMRHQPVLEDGLIVQEGAIPGALAPILPLTFLAANAVESRSTGRSLVRRLRRALREAASPVEGPYHGPVDRSQTYLVMSSDDGNGRLVLEDDRAHIEWPDIGARPPFQRDNTVLERAAAAIGATYLPNPAWQLFRKDLTTVHPLGGCTMADDAERGAVNHKGQVFSGRTGDGVHEGLYVADGAVIPCAVGINPSFTISAVAERTCALLAADRGWTIDYGPDVIPVRRDTGVTKAGLQFTEEMKGQISLGDGGVAELSFMVTTATDDLDALLRDAASPARMTGTVTCAALSATPLELTKGTFQLFVDEPSQFETKTMRYTMELESVEGGTWRLEGRKLIHHDRAFDMWADTTTLFVTVSEGAAAGGPVAATGELRISLEHFIRLLTTMTVTGVTDETTRLRYLGRFGKEFAGTLWRIYGGVFAEPTDFETAPATRTRRTLDAPTPETHSVKTSDDTRVQLTRYAGGKKGPVIMAPGFGVSTESFSTDTVDTNLVEFLAQHDYDVWLFDYRASPHLPSAGTAFTLDDVAMRDWPAAIDAVIDISEAPNGVQPLAHCVGSMTFLMAMMGGAVPRAKVRSAICSQLTTHPVTNIENQLKSLIRLGNMLEAVGFDSLTTDVKPKLADELLDAALHLNPIAEDEKCHQPSCRRIFAFFGPSYRHAQLNDATHRAIPGMFGTSSVTAFEHLSKIVNARQIVDHRGGDTYLPHLDRLDLPIFFLAGELNQEFYPKTSKITYDMLCSRFDATQYGRKVVEAYSHMDCFCGKDAVRDVYPTLLEQLEAYPS